MTLSLPASQTPASDTIHLDAALGKAIKAKTEVVEPPAPKGLMLYTDGGVRPTNPGPAGWGAHGYMYTTAKPKRGSGAGDHVLTAAGYVTKAAAADNPTQYAEVTPIHYIDGLGSFPMPVSNNVAELAGAIAALQHALEYDVKTVLVMTDSEYVRKGFSEWADGWVRKNWIRADGSEVPNQNYWKLLLQARDQLRARGTKVKIDWIRSHSGHLGNTQADMLATMGVMASQRGQVRQDITITAAEGYWRYEAHRHPLLHHRRLYFNTQTAFCRPGVYYVGEHGKEDDLLGKRNSDGAYAIVLLEKPEPVIEMLREMQIARAGEVDSLVMMRLEQIFNADTHRYLTNQGELAVGFNRDRPMDLQTHDDPPMPVSRELRPALIAMRAVEAIEELYEKLALFDAQSPLIVRTDLTAILYETTLKSGKKGEPETPAMKLKADYQVGFAALEVQANYQAGAEVACASVILTLGIDLPDRNSLKRLETANPVVTLISWTEAPDVFRYATVIESGGDKAIFEGAYSNLRIVPLAGSGSATPTQ